MFPSFSECHKYHYPCFLATLRNISSIMPMQLDRTWFNADCGLSCVYRDYRLSCRSEARLKRHRKSLVMMSSRCEFDPGPDVPPSTIAQHYHHHHHHHHEMMSESVPASASSYPTLTSALDAEFDVGYLSSQGNNGCCVAASASFVDRQPLPLPVLDCACSDGRFRLRRGENLDDAGRRESVQTKCSESASFKDAATDRLLRMPDAILLPVADSAVNYGLEETGTTLRTVNVCRSCCTDSPVT